LWVLGKSSGGEGETPLASGKFGGGEGKKHGGRENLPGADIKSPRKLRQLPGGEKVGGVERKKGEKSISCAWRSKK